MTSTAPATHRFILVDQPDGRQTTHVYTATELAEKLTSLQVACLGLGRTITIDGKPWTDMQAHVNAARKAPLQLKRPSARGAA